MSLLQPLGATMPIAERQSKWVADHLTGEYVLPERHELVATMNSERDKMFKRYVASKRHTMQIDFDDYFVEVAKERAAGADRARAQGFRLPIEPKAAPAGDSVAA